MKMLWVIGCSLLLMVFGALAIAQTTAVAVINPGFEEGSEGWVLPPNYQVDTDTAHTGKSSLKIVNTDPGVYQLASQSLKFQPDAAYKFSVWVKTQDVAGAEGGATITIEFWGKDGKYLGGSYPAGILGTSDWTLVEGETSPVPDETVNMIITVYLRKGVTGTAWFDDIRVEPFYARPLDVGLVKPGYRGMLEANNPDQEVLILAKVASRFAGGYDSAKTKLRTRITSAGKTVLEKTTKPKAGMNRISFDAGKLAVGKYDISVDLLEPSGAVAQNRQLQLDKTAAGSPKPVVYLDSYGRTIRNGKPYFPLGLYFGPGPDPENSYKPHIDRVSDSPFNTIMCYGINTFSLRTIREYLDYLDSKDVSILYSLKDIQKGIAYYEENMLGLGDEKSQVNGLVTEFRDHPALLGWYLNDEAPVKFQDRLMERYQTVKSLDPNHPTWSVLCDPPSLFSYLETADVLGSDPYPINLRPITVVSDWAKATANVSDGNKGFWMVPQIMDWNVYNYDRGVRAPSLDEIITMSYLCLIEGAKGLVYYSYFDLTRDSLGFDNRWQDVVIMGKEIKQLEPAVLSIEKPEKIAIKGESAGVRSRVFTAKSGTSYLLLSNTNPVKGAAISVKVPVGADAQLLKHAVLSDLGLDNRYAIVGLGPSQSATVIISR